MHGAEYPQVPADFGHWLAGFIDGEGCFYIRTGQSTDGRLRYACRFALRLRADDIAALHAIPRTTGIGRVYDTPIPARDRGDGYVRNPSVYWDISVKADCLALIALLDRFPLRSKKQRDFAIWREAVDWWCLEGKRGSSGPRDWSHLIALKEQLAVAREYRHAAS